MSRYLSLFVLAGGLAGLAAAAVPALPVPGVAADYVAEALARNLGLAGQQLEVERAEARLAEARAAFQPRLDLTARYTRSEGGRTIEFPAGDLLNGVYGTLNDYLRSQGRTGGFPTIVNQSIPLLRPHEQQTSLRLVQPLYRPEIARGARAAQAGLAARSAQWAAYRRELRLTVLAAYYGYLQAGQAVHILESASELTAEALRVNRQLRAVDRLTDDRVLRAEAEDLAVQQQRMEAERDRHAAGNYFNFLLNRPLDSAILTPPAEEMATLTADLLAAEPDPTLTVDRREELASLHESLTAANAVESAARARLYPTVGLAVEGGIQGESYRSGSGANFLQGSLVAEVNLWDGRRQHSAIHQARVDRRRAEIDLEQAQLQLNLQLRQSADEYRAATAALRAAAARRRALDGAFALVAARDREGLANQLSFIDARTERTRAALNEEITRQRLFTAASALDRAAALSPLP
jgi:outer membrane protein TolC